MELISFSSNDSDGFLDYLQSSNDKLIKRMSKERADEEVKNNPAHEGYLDKSYVKHVNDDEELPRMREKLKELPEGGIIQLFIFIMLALDYYNLQSDN